MYTSFVLQRLEYMPLGKRVQSLRDLKTFYLGSFESKTRIALGFPLSAAWWSALNPLLLVSIMSALWSSNRASISSRFFEIASWSGVSPSLSWREGWQDRRSRIFTTPTCPEIIRDKGKDIKRISDSWQTNHFKSVKENAQQYPLGLNFIRG